MKQVLQNLKNGETILAEVPIPAASEGHVLIATRRTLVSAGTERMLVEFGKSGLIGKARLQPDKVRMVLDKTRTDGLLPTLEAVRSKLDQPLPLGYCNVGTVLEVGSNVQGFKPGDRVVSNGSHAEVVSVPSNLCAPIPDGVSDDEAAFTVLGAIALQGVRLVGPTLGEAVVVTGLGLVGLITVQILRANGCRVLGIDLDSDKLEIARRFGAETVDVSKGEDPVRTGIAFSRGRGVDAVILTASTKSSEPVSQSAQMCRKRGRIVQVGVTGLELSRADFYDKELTFQVSCSYGPGRYDPEYEGGGKDYPIGFVRWTELRNFEAVLDLLKDGKLDISPLISRHYSIKEAKAAYQQLSDNKSVLGIILKYPERKADERGRIISRPGLQPVSSSQQASPHVSFIGAGNYAGRILIPAFKKAGANLSTVATMGGVSGSHYGSKHGFMRVTTDASLLIEEEGVSAVVIATRHDTHATYVCSCLKAGKHVFVEKPLALTEKEVDAIEASYRAANQQAYEAGEACKGTLIMVGFNRRFSPLVQKMKDLLMGINEPKSFIMTVNAGAIPPDHWTQDSKVGGGRIIGEACHFVDLLRFLASSPIEGYQVTYMGKASGARVRGDKASFTLRFADGSFGTVHYLANGHKSFPKERLEVFCGERVLQLDNFRKLTGYGWPGFHRMKLWRQDKGQISCAAAFVGALREGKPAPIPFEELLEVSRVTIDIAREH